MCIRDRYYITCDSETDGPAQDWIWADAAQMEAEIPVSYTHLDVYKRQHIYEVRIVAWYDNEMSYTCQLIRTLKHLKKFIK